MNERLWRNCNILEDEFHFVCECTLYNDLRHTYIPEYYRCRPNMVKIIELLSCENNIILKNLSAFFKAFQVRNLHHYVTEWLVVPFVLGNIYAIAMLRILLFTVNSLLFRYIHVCIMHICISL